MGNLDIIIEKKGAKREGARARVRRKAAKREAEPARDVCAVRRSAGSGRSSPGRLLRGCTSARARTSRWRPLRGEGPPPRRRRCSTCHTHTRCSRLPSRPTNCPATPAQTNAWKRPPRTSRQGEAVASHREKGDLVSRRGVCAHGVCILPSHTLFTCSNRPCLKPMPASHHPLTHEHLWKRVR